tara:strand:- start:719 stop:889 length:171 start_codon:yes stop_codon:yes gene_type:complete
MMMENIINEEPQSTPITDSQRLALKLILFALAIIRPWQYAHQQADRFIEWIKAELG